MRIKSLLLILILANSTLKGQDNHAVDLKLNSTNKPEKIILLNDNSQLVLSVSEIELSKELTLTRIESGDASFELQKIQIKIPEIQNYKVWNNDEIIHLLVTTWQNGELSVIHQSFDTELNQKGENVIYTFKSDTKEGCGSVLICKNKYNGATYIYHEKPYQKDKKEEATVVWFDTFMSEIARQDYFLPHADKARKVNVPFAGKEKLFLLKRVFENGKNEYYLLSFSKHTLVPTNKNIGYGTVRITDLLYAINENEEIHIMATTAPASGGKTNSFLAAKYNSEGVQQENSFFQNELVENMLFKTTLKKMPFVQIKRIESLVDGNGDAVFGWCATGIETTKKGEQFVYNQDLYLMWPYQNPTRVHIDSYNITTTPSDAGQILPILIQNKYGFALMSNLYEIAPKQKTHSSTNQIKIDFFHFDDSTLKGSSIVKLPDTTKWYSSCKPVLKENNLYLISIKTEGGFQLNTIPLNL